MTEKDRLRRLNEDYIRAGLLGDVAWYETHLAEDFTCIEPDGDLLDKPAFLRVTAAGSGLTTYQLDDVSLRLYGEVALVQAQGTWTARDGTRGTSRYTDVYVRRNGAWEVVSAQVTRPERRA